MSLFRPHYLKCLKCGAKGFALTEESRSGLQQEIDMAVTGNFWVRKSGTTGYAGYCLRCNVKATGPFIAKEDIGP
jgi:hypothetical protein